MKPLNSSRIYAVHCDGGILSAGYIFSENDGTNAQLFFKRGAV